MEQKSKAKGRTMTTTPYLSDYLPIPNHIAGFALTASLFILSLLGLARHNLSGEILGSQSVSASASTSATSLRSQSYFVFDQDEEPLVLDTAAGEKMTSDAYYVFLQKFPLKSSFKMIFHTEVIVCPRETFSKDATFLNMLDGLVDRLGMQDATESPFVTIEKKQWSEQSEPGCVQLGYGGGSCGSGCCGSPHKQQNRNYALNSRQAVIDNAMGDYKELYFYGVSGGCPDCADAISGEDAYKAVCHGHMNAIEMGGLPKCVSNWSGQDYNPFTNNCNTFTSTVLKCVYGLSDAKPHLGVSDLRNVDCPSEKTPDGSDVGQCMTPTMDESFEATDVSGLSFE